MSVLLQIDGVDVTVADDDPRVPKVQPLLNEVVPASVTNYQARSALRAFGLRDKVDAAIRGADQSVTANAEALEAWDYANNFYRDQAFIVSLGPSFGLKPSDIDDLFRAAAKVS